MSRSKRGRIALVFEPGKIRPNSVKIAAEFATECNIAVRNFVPISPKWKEYKNKIGIFKNYIKQVVVSVWTLGFPLFMSMCIWYLINFIPEFNLNMLILFMLSLFINTCSAHDDH